MTYDRLNYRFIEKRSAYANFVSHLEYLNSAQPENRCARRCVVRIVKVRGYDGEISARDGWDTYCRNSRYHIGFMKENGIAE